VEAEMEADLDNADSVMSTVAVIVVEVEGKEMLDRDGADKMIVEKLAGVADVTTLVVVLKELAILDLIAV